MTPRRKTTPVPEPARAPDLDALTAKAVSAQLDHVVADLDAVAEVAWTGLAAAEAVALPTSHERHLSALLRLALGTTAAGVARVRMAMRALGGDP